MRKVVNLRLSLFPSPTVIRKTENNDDFSAGYINYYLCNGAVILPEFGDKKADAVAKKTLQALFPRRDMVQLNIDGIGSGRGGNTLYDATRTYLKTHHII
ncbi:MAG: agmatine deiminase family protein [Methylococcales bacterium]|nr:agmatine deiminase family protein [Methylococcales bacterium]